MALPIKNGVGNGNLMGVSNNHRAYTLSVTQTEDQQATDNGLSYNLNTGIISISGAADSAMMYFKNNESQAVVIDAIAIGSGDIQGGGAASDDMLVTVVKNPTAGDIVTDATPVSINANRNFGSANTLQDSLVYKGKDGGTLTDGTVALTLYSDQGSRLLAGINIELTKGTSIGIKIDPNLSSGTINAYAAIICHVKDAKNDLS